MRISPCPTLIRPRASPTTTFLPLAPRHMEKSSLFWLSGSCGGCLASPQRSSPVAASHTFTAQAVVVVVRRRKTENKKGGGMLVYKVKVALQYYFTSPPVYLSRYIYIYIYHTPVGTNLKAGTYLCRQRGTQVSAHKTPRDASIWGNGRSRRDVSE